MTGETRPMDGCRGLEIAHRQEDASLRWNRAVVKQSSHGRGPTSRPSLEVGRVPAVRRSSNQGAPAPGPGLTPFPTPLAGRGDGSAAFAPTAEKHSYGDR